MIQRVLDRVIILEKVQEMDRDESYMEKWSRGKENIKMEREISANQV